MAFFIIQATIMQPEHPISRPLERVVLVGFMGAGKSTLGPILAGRLGWRFLDADLELESEAGSKIAELFTTVGEPAFRRMEAEVVARLLGRPKSVIALGGGAVEIEATRLLLANSPNTCAVFLRAPLEVLLDRCEQQPDAAVRPILRHRDAVRQRFHTRLPHYESAHITVDTEGLTPHTVADNLLQQMFEASYAIPLYQKAITT
jgi:shikimate kinase